MIKKWCNRIGLVVFGLVVLSLISGASYQFISTKLDEKAYPPPGELVDIGGYKLHFYKTGSGGPSVILDSGLGCPGIGWGLVQPEIAKFTQVVSYDRAGTGWSEKSPFPRTSRQIVEELHTMLHVAKVEQPYILVGHSFGGANVQLYAATYPDEVVGIVLVDACHEEQLRRLPSNPLVSPLKLLQSSKVAYLMASCGISRLALQGFLRKMMTALPEITQKAILALSSTTKNYCTNVAEEHSLAESMKQLENADQLLSRNKPCVVITAGLASDLSQVGVPQEYMNEMQAVWNVLQLELVSKFEGSHQIIAEKSDHMIPWHQPELIVNAVKELIDQNNQSENSATPPT